MYLVLQAVVCILHLENRVGLKSIESILRSGLSNAIHGKLEWIKSIAIQKRQDEFINRITNIVQTRILGTFAAPSQWRFPLAEDGSMGSLWMDNNRTRLMANDLELLKSHSLIRMGIRDGCSGAFLVIEQRSQSYERRRITQLST